MDEAFLEERIREAIEAGELPDRLPDQLLGGPASGGRCAICGNGTHGGIEMELVFGDDDEPDRARYYAHPRCLAIYERALLDALDDPAARLMKRPRTTH